MLTPNSSVVETAIKHMVQVYLQPDRGTFYLEHNQINKLTLNQMFKTALSANCIDEQLIH